jgi:pre-mRNA-splicing helicase BRR2
MRTCSILLAVTQKVLHSQVIKNCDSPCCPQAMMRPCYSAILTHATPDKPAIVFVPTRKHVRLTAVDLLTSAAADGNPHRCVHEVCF